VTLITTNDDPITHGKTITFTAIPAAPLFKDITIPNDAVIEFHATDHFTAPIDKQQLLNTKEDAAIAYIAIEKPDEKWPAVNAGVDNRTAAPFYLIWKNPQKSHISSEQWVMMLAGFSIEDTFIKRYPNIAPASTLSASDPVMLGFKTFKTNCLSCHTMNRQGNSTIGPDLNVPYNPTEYLSEKHLKLFIRNPQNLRYYPSDRMIAFPASVITDDELNGLVAYLKYMRDRKVITSAL
jgi:cytochrome c2